MTTSVIHYDLIKCMKAISELHSKISVIAISDGFYEEYELALCEYFDYRDFPMDKGDEISEDLFQDEEEFSRFMSWFCSYFVTDEYDRSFPEIYLSGYEGELTALEKEILHSYKDSRLELYEVQRTEPGCGLELKNIFVDRVIYVHDEFYSKALCKWDLVYAGLIAIRGFHFLSGFNPVIIPPRLKPVIEKAIDEIYYEERKDFPTVQEFLRQNSSEIFALIDRRARDFHNRADIKNTEGDLLFFVTLYYRIEDVPAFMEKMAGSALFISDKMDIDSKSGLTRADYIWVKRESMLDHIPECTTQGLLFLGGHSLRARCNSRERAEKLRAILEELCGELIKFKMAVYEKPQEELFRDSALLRLPGTESRGDSEYTDLLKEVSLRHYKNWIDEKIPALGNLTPREAMRAPQSRKNLVNLLKELENQNERAIRKGIRHADLLAFPADMIRHELGLSF